MLVYQRVATVSWLHWPRRKMGRNKGFTCSSTFTTSTQLTPPAMHRKRVKHVRLSDSDSWGQIQALFLGRCFFAPEWGHIPGYSRYHLVMTNTLPWENPPIFNRYTIYKRPFSMAMLNNQRVDTKPFTRPLCHYLRPSPQKNKWFKWLATFPGLGEIPVAIFV